MKASLLVLLMLAAGGKQGSLEALLDGSGFVRVPAGEFTMGSPNGNEDERPPHKVRITKAFEIGKYEVTQAQWDAVMADAHHPDIDVNPSSARGPMRPVENVNWEDTQQFLRNLNSRDAKHTYRLPTEAEWEYAARNGPPNEPGAWCAETAEKQTHEVGTKAPNKLGLHDMIGNVQEWVSDWYAPDYYASSPAADPQGPSAHLSYRVYRGGGWITDGKNCRRAYRAFDLPLNKHAAVGFRIVRVPR